MRPLYEDYEAPEEWEMVCSPIGGLHIQDMGLV